MSKSKHVVWGWEDQDGNPRYFGWGPFKRVGIHPASTLWLRRDEFDSPLTQWLRTLDVEPFRMLSVPVIPMTKSAARAYCVQKKEKCKAEGFDILDVRPIGTYIGGGQRRRVMGPDLTIFLSVRAAARSAGVNPSTITRWCQTEGTEWDYLN